MKINLMIIGTQKAGTTSLFYYMKQHPDVYFSEVKEITFFDNDHFYEKGIKYFHSFFPNYRNQKITATADVHLLPSVIAPKRVFDYNPQMKFIVLLREPVERAYSAYNYAQKNGWENASISFLESMEIEDERKNDKNLARKNDLLYFHNGLYFQHLSCWFSFFPKEAFYILKDEELKKNGNECMKNLFRFLEVDTSIKVDTNKEYNKAGEAKYKDLQKFILNKESTSKKIIGKLLPSKLRILIRATVFKKLIELNTINKENTPLNHTDKIKAKEYFKKDLFHLKESLSISFED